MKKASFVLLLVLLFVGLFFRFGSAQSPCPFTPMTQEWIACHNEWVSICVNNTDWRSEFRIVCEELIRRKYLAQQIKPVSPVSAWQCPVTHPIKGNFTTYSGERCIFHVPGGQFYDRTKPERCYATAGDAIGDGCRASLR